MGFAQAKKYDLEVWAPGVEDWLEVSSSRTSAIPGAPDGDPLSPEPGAKPELVHTLKGRGSPSRGRSRRSSRPTSSPTARS